MRFITPITLILLIFITDPVQCQTWRRALKINSNVAIPGNVQPDVWYNQKDVATYTSKTLEDAYLISAEGQSYAGEPSNFKSLFIKDWRDNLITVDQVLIKICTTGVIRKQILFDASSSTFNNWLAVPNIISSDWTDLTSSTPYQSKWVGIDPSTWTRRSFCIWNYADVCSVDRAFFLITTWTGICDLEWGEGYSQPGIFYSNVATLGLNELDQVAVEADTFIIEIRYKIATSHPTIIPTINPTFPTMEPTLIPTSNPTIEPTLMPTIYPTVNPTFNPSVFPTSTPTMKPTTECSNDEDALLKISFDYVIQDADVSRNIILDTLSNAAGIFVETDIDSTTNCNVSDYSVFIQLDDNLQNANINASICFKCGNNGKLEINFAEQDLEDKFEKTVDDNTDILTVDVKEIEVEAAEGAVNEIATTQIFVTDNKKNGEEKRSLMENPLLIPIMIGVVSVLTCLVCCFIFIIYYLRKKRRGMDNQTQQMAQDNIQLTKVASISEKNGTTAGFDVDIEDNGTFTPNGDNGELHAWLNDIGLVKYYERFINEGYGNNINKLNSIDDATLIKIGVDKMAHRKALLLNASKRINTSDVNKLIGEDLPDEEEQDDNELYEDYGNMDEIHKTPNDMTPMVSTGGV